MQLDSWICIDWKPQTLFSFRLEFVFEFPSETVGVLECTQRSLRFGFSTCKTWTFLFILVEHYLCCFECELVALTDHELVHHHIIKGLPDINTTNTADTPKHSGGRILQLFFTPSSPLNLPSLLRSQKASFGRPKFLHCLSDSWCMIVAGLGQVRYLLLSLTHSCVKPSDK